MRDGRAEVVVHNHSERLVPSTNALEGDIWHNGKYDHTDVRSGVTLFHDNKRLIGRNNSDGKLTSDIEHWGLPAHIDDAGLPYFRVNNEKIRPEEFSALQLLRLKEIAQMYTGKIVTQAVITVPAYFSDAQRRATTQAAAIAGLTVLRIIDEPTAVAIAYLWKFNRPKNVLVIDMGGGTLDCVLVRYSAREKKQIFVVEATSGDNRLGGQDFNYPLDKLVQKQLPDVPLEEIRALAEKLKRGDDSEIIFSARGQQCRISQAVYEKSLSKPLKKAMDVLDEVLRLDASAEVILTGGGSLHPAFSKAVRSRLEGRSFLPQRPPSEVVAEGAAIATEAAQLGIVLTAVLPRSIGIRIRRKTNSRKKGNTAVKKYEDDIMEVILQRNTPIPCEISQTFSAIDLEETEIAIFEGEFAKASDNICLDEFSIQAPEGADIKVTFSVDVKCELCVTATSIDAKIVFLVKRRHRELSDSELRTLQDKANQRFASSKKASSIAVVNAIDTELPVARPSSPAALAMGGGPRRSKRKFTK